MTIYNSLGLLRLVILGIVVLSLSCTSLKQNNEAPMVVTSDQEKAWDRILDGALNSEYTAWNETRALKTIQRITKKLISSDAELSAVVPSVNIKIHKTEKVYVQAGLFNKLYLSRGALLTLKYESELAFLIARELAVLKSKKLIDRFLASKDQNSEYLNGNWFSKDGLFALPEEKQLAFDREGIQLLYKAHYDSRGAASLLQRWSELANATGSSPFEQAKILPLAKERLQEVRDEIAKLSPLRNPIVTSRDFESFLTWLASQAKGKLNAGRTAVN